MERNEILNFRVNIQANSNPFPDAVWKWHRFMRIVVGRGWHNPIKKLFKKFQIFATHHIFIKHTAYKVMINMGIIDVGILITYYLQGAQMIQNSDFGYWPSRVSKAKKGLYKVSFFS
jgi:hypothetical protein